MADEEKDPRKLIEEDKAREEKADLQKETKPKDDGVPWDTRKAWQGVIGVIVLFFVFIVIVAAFQAFLPSPLLLGVSSILLYVAILGLVYLLIGGRIDALAFKKFPFFKAAGYSILFFVAVIIFEVIWVQFLRIVGITPPDSAAPIIEMYGSTALAFVVIFILTVLVAPFVEEVFFRSFLYQAFRKRYGVTAGILISAIVFGFFHFSFLAALPVFILIGIFLGYIFEKFHSVYPAIMLHALNNFVFFVILVVSQSTPK